MRINKLVKWSMSAVRVAVTKGILGHRLCLPQDGKPVYLGRGSRLIVVDGDVLELGRGVYIDVNCRFQICTSARLNVRLFDHDHVFDYDGVYEKAVASPVSIGERYWFGANSLVTKGVSIANRICVGGGRRGSVPYGIGRICWGALASGV